MPESEYADSARSLVMDSVRKPREHVTGESDEIGEHVTGNVAELKVYCGLSSHDTAQRIAGTATDKAGDQVTI